MGSVDAKLGEVVELFAGDYGSERDDITPGGPDVPIPMDALTDGSKFDALCMKMNTYPAELLQALIEARRTPFQIIRGYIEERIGQFSEVQQEAVLDGILGTQVSPLRAELGISKSGCRALDTDDLKDFVQAEINAVMNPEENS